MASKKISLKKNFIMNAILTMSNFIFPLITFPYISRILKPSGTGKVQLAASVVSYFAMFAQLGIPTYGIRATSRVRDDREELSRTVQELLIINLVMSAFAYLVYFIALFNVPKMCSDKVLYLISSLTILFNAIGIEWMYRGLEQYTYITVRSIAFKAIAVAAMLTLVHARSDYVLYGGISIFASSASGVMNFINARKYITMKPVGGYHFRRHLKPVLVFFAMSCATTVYLNLDTVMLGFMTSDADVGYYNAAVKVKNILVSIVTSLGTVLLPRASYYVEQGDMDEFHRISRKALNFVWIFATPLMIYFILYAREGLLFLSGPEYVPAIPAMQIIMPTLLFIGLSNITGIQILVPLGREKTVLYSEIAGAVTDLIINALLIPRYKAAGAAFGTTVAELVVLLVQYFSLRKEIRPAFARISYWKILVSVVAASLAGLTGKLIPAGGMSATLHEFVQLAVSAVLFFGVYLVLMLVLKEKLTGEIVTGLLHRKSRANAAAEQKQ